METMEVLSEKIILEKVLAKGALKYYLIETEEIIENKKVTTYGVSIVSYLFENTEESKVLSITENRDEAEKFLIMLTENVVIPCLLEELAEDFIGD